MEQATLATLTADIAAAFVSHNAIAPAELGGLIGSIGGALTALGTEPTPEPEFVPAVDPRKSLKADHIVSLIDGTKHKMLKRHLSTHGLTPEQYRERYGLKADYPMVAPNYSERRRELAKAIGLGRHPGASRGGRRSKAA